MMGFKRRRRGTAIVETQKGILVVAGRGKNFMTPGGGAEKWESRRRASIRELREETGLKAISSKYLFSYKSPVYSNGKYSWKDYHKVFLIKVDENKKASPRHEVKYVDYYNSNSQIKLSRTTKEIIGRYLSEK